MQVNLSSGECNIISTGMTFLFGEDKDLTIEVTADNGFQFKIVMEFKIDDNSESRIDTKFYENDKYIYSFEENSSKLTYTFASPEYPI